MRRGGHDAPSRPGIRPRLGRSGFTSGRLRLLIGMSGRYCVRGVALLAAWLSLTTIACSTPISVTKVDPGFIQRALATNAVADGEMSDATRTVLEEEGLIDRSDEREAVIKTLHGAIVSGRRGARVLFALAELSYLQGLKSRDRRYYLGAAVYAWAFLFPDDPADAPNQFDRRLRAAAD